MGTGTGQFGDDVREVLGAPDPRRSSLSGPVVGRRPPSGTGPLGLRTNFREFPLCEVRAKSSRYWVESAVRANRGAAPRVRYRGARCTAHSALAAAFGTLRWRTAGVDITSQPSARRPGGPIRKDPQMSPALRIAKGCIRSEADCDTHCPTLRSGRLTPREVYSREPPGPQSWGALYYVVFLREGILLV